MRYIWLIVLMLMGPWGSESGLAAPVGSEHSSSISISTSASKLSWTHPLGVVLSLGTGTADLGRFYEGANSYVDLIKRDRPDLLLELPRQNWQVQGELGVRYYFPHYVMCQVSWGLLHHSASMTLPPGYVRGRLSYRNWVLEMPLLVGAYYPLFQRITLYSALGPSIFLLSRSYWDYDLTELSDFHATRGGGFHVLAGGSVTVTRYLSVGLEFRYRNIRTGLLFPTSALTPPSEPIPEMNLSGISGSVMLQVFPFRTQR